MTEYGIFNDEGLLEGQFYDRATADAALADMYSEDDAHVAECCPDHREQERATCEECDHEDDESEGDEDDDQQEEDDT